MTKIPYLLLLAIILANSQPTNLQTNTHGDSFRPVFQQNGPQVSQTLINQTQSKPSSDDENHRQNPPPQIYELNQDNRPQNFTPPKPPINLTHFVQHQNEAQRNRSKQQIVTQFNGNTQQNTQDGIGGVVSLGNIHHHLASFNNGNNGNSGNNGIRDNQQRRSSHDEQKKPSKPDEKDEQNQPRRNQSRTSNSLPNTQGNNVIEIKQTQGQGQDDSSRPPLPVLNSSSSQSRPPLFPPVVPCKTDADCAPPGPLRMNIQATCNLTSLKCEFKST